MTATPRSYEEACRIFRWRIPDRYNLAFDVCDRQTMAGADGHRTALIVETPDGGADRYTFHVLRLLSNKLANVLAEAGVTPGDRVALALEPGLEAAVAVLAVARMGAVTVPIPPRLGSEPLAWRLGDSAAMVLIADPGVVPALDRVRDDLGKLRLVLVPESAPKGCVELWAEMERASDSFQPLVTPSGHPAFIFYPSDGFGRPPGAVLPHRAMAGGLPAVEMSLGFFPQFGDVMWTSADWMSAEALFRAVLPAWRHGAPVVAAAGGFEPARALETLSRQGVRAAYLPPSHLDLLCEAAGGRPHAAPRALASGPEPLDEALHERVIKVFGLHANEAWGTLETGAVAANLAGLMELRPPSPGRTAPGLVIEATDERGRPMKAEERGILAISRDAPGNFLGYWGDGVEGPARRANGWLLTGRLGRRDLDNYVWPEALSLPDGAARIGEARVSLDEVEAALEAHPAVIRAGVAEVSEGDLRAFVEVKPGAESDLADQLRDWVALLRGPAERPRRVELVETLPMDAQGRPDRGQLGGLRLRVGAPGAEDRWRPQPK